MHFSLEKTAPLVVQRYDAVIYQVFVYLSKCNPPQTKNVLVQWRIKVEENCMFQLELNVLNLMEFIQYIELRNYAVHSIRYGWFTSTNSGTESSIKFSLSKLRNSPGTGGLS